MRKSAGSALRVGSQHWAAALVFGIAVAGALVARADTVTLTAVRDNTLFESSTGNLSNGAGPVFFSGRTNGGSIRRALVRFDFATIPAGATVDSVQLHLHVSRSPDSVPRNFDVHRVLADWGEGTSNTSQGTGTTATTNDATWIHRFRPGTLWTNAGGDFVATASASLVVISEGNYVWRGPGLTANVQNWLGMPATNFGWLLRGNETTSQTARRFDSRENSTPANRPRLVVFYTPETPALPSTWGRLKVRYR
jgi:hypothetical protein